jgi:hypothetical protein
MSTPDIVRNWSIYVKGKKCATATGSELDVVSGDEMQIGDGQVVSISEGVTTTTLKIDAITTFGGIAELRLLNQALLNKQWVQVAAGVINGQIQQIDMRVSTANYKTEMKAGTQTVNFQLQGKAPVAA